MLTLNQPNTEQPGTIRTLVFNMEMDYSGRVSNPRHPIPSYPDVRVLFRTRISTPLEIRSRSSAMSQSSEKPARSFMVSVIE